MRNISIIIVIFLLSSALFAYPVLIYGPTLEISSEPPESLTSSEIADDEIITSGTERAYIAICDGQMLELSENTSVKFFSESKAIEVINGFVIIHLDEPPDTLCYSIRLRFAEIRYAGEDSVFFKTGDDEAYWFSRRNILSNGKHRIAVNKWFEKSSEDADYLFDLIEKGEIPTPDFPFDFPSERRVRFHQNTRGYAGIATYKSESYYYGGLIYKLNYWEIEFAYDFWLAFSRSGKFYNEAWDEWGDILNHIHHLQLFRPSDPFYMRAGLIQKLTFGHGILVDNYDNAVFLPFEKHNGLQIQLDVKRFRGAVFINDIGEPRVIGAHFEQDTKQNITLSFTYAGDFDQLSNIEDSDGDSYPDRTDPEPEKFNRPTDSIILESDSQRLDEFDSRQVHGIAFGLSHRFLDAKSFYGDITGDIAMLNNVGTGVSFPNLTFGYGWVTVGAGVDFQTPGFFDGIFDVGYEYDKARFIEDEDGNLELVTLRSDLAETEGWLYGWNNSFSLNIPKYCSFRTKFRDLYREDERDKKFKLVLDNEYPFTKYVTSTSFFIEQKNVAKLLRQRTDGEIWGFEIEFKPHHSVDAEIRYRERYSDDNDNGTIGSGETERNISASLTVNGTYWWNRFLEWWEKR